MRNVALALSGLLALAVAVFVAWPTPEADTIYLKGGARQSASTDVEIQNSLDITLDFGAQHRAYFVAQYEQLPTRHDRERIERLGDIRFLDAVPVNGYIVSVPANDGMNQLNSLRSRSPPASQVFTMRPEDKLAGNLYALDPATGDVVVHSDFPVYMRRPLDVPEDSRPQIAVVVRFFEDVAAVDQTGILIAATAERSGAPIDNSSVTQGNAWSVLIPKGTLDALRENPQVQYVEGQPPAVINDSDDARVLLGVDVGLIERGTGVTIAQWEICQPYNAHTDLATGVSHGDTVTAFCQDTAKNLHATMVAGIMTGDGLVNLNYRGIAPDAEVIAFDLGLNGPQGEYPDAIAAGASISNNSWGYLYDEDLFSNLMDQPQKWYPDMASHFDSITSGRTASGSANDFDSRMLVVTTTGNAGHIAPWNATRIANSAKNALSVGSVATGSGDATYKPAHSSGRGPTGDGRLSPILVAPGIEVLDDGGITTTSPINTYFADYGTSFSAPMVSGAAALITEKYKNTCNSFLPRPMELRAILVHTAKDLMNAEQEAKSLELIPSAMYHPGILPGNHYAGPDFVFGYGFPRVDNAINLVGDSHFITDEIDRGYIDYPIFIDSIDMLENGYLRVTLAWDDPPSNVNSFPSAEHGFLQNDLDLVIIDPAGKRHFPWILDHESPQLAATAATRFLSEFSGPTVRDRRNTVEQVLVEVPNNLLNNTWVIRVWGRSVPLDPQEFVLVSSIINPADACGDITRRVVRYAPVPPDSEVLYWLLIIAVIILALLVLATILRIWYHYVANADSQTARLMIVLLLLFLLLVFFILLRWEVAALGLMLIILAVIAYANGL